MPIDDESIVQSYDRLYKSPNHFGDRRWLYRPFVKALVAKAELVPGSFLLDAGCGQGFFTGLFAENGLKTHGVDLSGVGIAAATQTYASPSVSFETGDILQMNFKRKFDSIFTRSCSLYNSDKFEGERTVTETLLSYLREGGVLIFDYHSKLNPKRRSSSWNYHTMQQVRKHFAIFPDAEIFFSLRVEASLFGRFSFTRAMSSFCSVVSRMTGAGGEIVAFVRKREAS